MATRSRVANGTATVADDGAAYARGTRLNASKVCANRCPCCPRFFSPSKPASMYRLAYPCTIDHATRLISSASAAGAIAAMIADGLPEHLAEKWRYVCGR